MSYKIFIASSSEQISLARAVQENLDRDFETRIWDQDLFELSNYTMDDLSAELDRADFGIFVLAPDDLITIRGEEKLMPRDNVIFELGMFAGKLGRERAFAIIPRGANNLHLPTDLAGLTLADYKPNRDDQNLNSALGTACNKIRKAVIKRGSVCIDKGLGVDLAVGLFPDFNGEFNTLIEDSKNITLFFIQSRRWRENHHDHLIEFLEKDESFLEIFLPNLSNHELISSLQKHFDDGPFIPGFIADAYRYFSDLEDKFPGKVSIRLFNLYPTYTFYKFDRDFIFAMYPTTSIRKSVPTFKIDIDSKMGEFFKKDISQLYSDCKKENKETIIQLSKAHHKDNQSNNLINRTEKASALN